MPRVSSLVAARGRLQAFFDAHEHHVFSYRQLQSLLQEHRDRWRLAQRITTPHLIAELEPLGLRTVELASHSQFPDLTRYIWQEASALEIAASVDRGAYLCHASAIVLHGLADLVPRMLYINREQSAKPAPDGALQQSNINRAFAAKSHRQSRRVYDLQQIAPHQVTYLSGKETLDLGVVSVTGPLGATLRVTSLERTLIDIVVRPAYGGGIYQVLEAYEAAREQLSVRRLVATLRKLNYRYPYHQAIGFLMERAGYTQHQLAPLRRFPHQFRFFLDYNLKPETAHFSTDWSLYYPRGF